MVEGSGLRRRLTDPVGVVEPGDPYEVGDDFYGIEDDDFYGKNNETPVYTLEEVETIIAEAQSAYEHDEEGNNNIKNVEVSIVVVLAIVLLFIFVYWKRSFAARRLQKRKSSMGDILPELTDDDDSIPPFEDVCLEDDYTMQADTGSEQDDDDIPDLC